MGGWHCVLFVEETGCERNHVCGDCRGVVCGGKKNGGGRGGGGRGVRK